MADNTISYLKAAFHSSINYVFLLILVGLGIPLRFRWPFLLLAGAMEFGLILSISQNKRFRRYVRARIGSRDRAPLKLNPDKIKDRLDEECLEKFRNFDEIYYQIKSNARLSDSLKAELFRITLSKLDQLRETYAHMLLVYQNYKQYLSKINRDEIERRIEALEREIPTREDKIARLMEHNVEILKERVKRIKKAWKNQEILETEMDVLQNAMSLIQDQTITISDPEGITMQIDSVLENMRDTESVLQEMDTFFDETGSASDENGTDEATKPEFPEPERKKQEQ